MSVTVLATLVNTCPIKNASSVVNEIIDVMSDSFWTSDIFELIAVQRCSVENQKGAIVVQSLW